MIRLRKLTTADLATYRYWKLPIHSYHQLNAPYFAKRDEAQVDTLIEEYQQTLPEQLRIITDDSNALIGEVSWYWKSVETLWLEIGIVIFDDNFWSKGIGHAALSQWITYLFASKPEIVRLGLSTWSGNHGMVKLAQKLGMQEEARYRKARIVDGKYYDSVSYGILKEEWLNSFQPNKALM